MIAPGLTVPLEIVDLSGLAPEDRRAEAERRAEVESRRPFDLAEGPLFRATLFRLDESDHAVLLAMHHIITDGWSFGVAAGELAALYGAFRDGHPSPLPEPPIQYADYALWQREWLRGEAQEALVDYWRHHLDGVRPLELPTDRPRPPIRSSRGDLRWFSLPRDLSEAIVELGRREGTTPFMTLLAAFQLLLARTSGQESIPVGSPIANRNRAEVEGLVGYFINMLALRADLSGNPTFRELLGRVREAALGAYEHQDLPLEMLVEALRPERDASRTPLFQVMFVLQNNQMPDTIPAGLELEPFGGAGTGTAKFDLSLAMAETGGGFSGSIEYATDLFDPATIDRMLGRLRTLLENVVGDPDRRVADLDLATADDLRTLAGWNATDVPIPSELSLHGLFETQAGRTPEAEAVAFEGRSFTYRELDRRADRLARRLQAMGVGPESRVGIAMGRSLDLAVALLGTLKAGAAYLPLDPAYPTARLDFMREDAGIGVLLTDRHGLDRRSGGGIEVVCVESDRDDPDDDGGRLNVRVDPEQAAYVIYTSGSTGEPRGVVVPHRSVVNHALDAARRFGLGAGDRVLQFASLSFDIAVEEIFPAWSAGASVVFRGEEIPPPAEFARWVGVEGITVLDLPTAFWHAWVAGLAEAGGLVPEGLRLVVVGGEEALSASYATWTPKSAETASAGSTPTGRPRRPSSPRPTSPSPARDRRRCRSARRSPTSGLTSSTRGSGPCRSVCPASFASAARAWPAATSTGQGGRPSGSCPTPSAHPVPECIGRETSPGGGPTAGSNSSGGSTTRSRSAATGSSRARSSRRSSACRGSARRRSRRATACWRPTSSRKTGRRSTRRP